MPTMKRRPDGRYCKQRKVTLISGAVKVVSGYGRTESEALVDLEAKVKALSMPTSKIQFGAMLDRWITERQDRWAPATLRAYRFSAKKLTEKIGLVRLCDLTPTSIEPTDSIRRYRNISQ